MVCALKRGLTLQDFEVLTFGMIVDYVIEYDNLQVDPDDDDIVREATQADMDRF